MDDCLDDVHLWVVRGRAFILPPPDCLPPERHSDASVPRSCNFDMWKTTARLEELIRWEGAFSLFSKLKHYGVDRQHGEASGPKCLVEQVDH